MPCIESLKKSDCGAEAEFICVNDGSTDASPQALDAWSAEDSRVRVLHQCNQGYGKAMNAGLDAARGEYIAIVEPDDWVEPDMFSVLLRLAEQSGADIVKAAHIEESANGSRVDTRFSQWEEGKVCKPEDLPDFLYGAPSIWAAIYRRTMLQAHEVRFSETPGASFQDLGFFMRTWAAASGIATTPRGLYHYRMDNPNSSTRRREEGAWAVLREIALCKSLFEKVAQHPAKLSMLVRRVFRSMQADYQSRVCDTLQDWLQECSRLLNSFCPLSDLQPQYFRKKEWHDISLLYTSPKDYPAKRKMGASILQRIFSIRTEGGRRCLRLLGTTCFIGKAHS